MKDVPAGNATIEGACSEQYRPGRSAAKGYYAGKAQDIMRAKETGDLGMIKGRAWVFGDDIDTDVIIPGKYLRTKDARLWAEHAMEGCDPDFAAKVKEGDVIVAGRNFGCGSSREQAPRALLGAGVAVVVARSFARIFYRNAINVGLPLIEADVLCRQGEIVEVDLAKGVVMVGDRVYQGTKLPAFLMEILDDGGLVSHRRRQKGLA